MSDNITPSGYIYGREPKQTNPFWNIENPGGPTEYVEFLKTSQVDIVKDNVNCTNYIINYLNHNKEEEIFNIYVPLFNEYYTKTEIDDKNYLVQSDLNNYYTKSEIDNKDFATNSSLDNYYTKTEIDDKNYLVQTDLDNYYTKSDIDNKNFATKSYLNNYYYTKGYIEQNYYTQTQIKNNYYTKTDTVNQINSICDQKIDEKIGGIINGQY